MGGGYLQPQYFCQVVASDANLEKPHEKFGVDVRVT